MVRKPGPREADRDRTCLPTSRLPSRSFSATGAGGGCRTQLGPGLGWADQAQPWELPVPGRGGRKEQPLGSQRHYRCRGHPRPPRGLGDGHRGLSDSAGACAATLLPTSQDCSPATLTCLAHKGWAPSPPAQLSHWSVPPRDLWSTCLPQQPPTLRRTLACEPVMTGSGGPASHGRTSRLRATGAGN